MLMKYVSTVQGRHSPLPIKPRGPRPAEPTHNYENHCISSQTTKEEPSSSQYMNISSFTSGAPPPNTAHHNGDTTGKTGNTPCQIITW